MKGGRGKTSIGGVSRGGGTNDNYLEGSFPHPLADGGGGVVYPDPSTSCELGAAEKGIGEGGVSPVNPSDGEGVLFSHKFVCSLLALAGKVAIGELVAVKALVHTAIRSVEDGEREAR